MYHAIVKRQLRRAFRDLGRGNYETILAGMAPEFEHVFFGDHPLGGKRHTGKTYRLWFERLARLFPDLGFELRNIVVNGWPWNTVAAQSGNRPTRDRTFSRVAEPSGIRRTS